MAEVIKLGENQQVLIGLSWKEKTNVKSKIKSFVLRDIKKEAKNNNYYTSTQLNNNSINYAFINNNSEDTIVGAKCISEKLENSIFIYEYKVKTKKGYQERWWFCSIVDRHYVESDLVFDNFSLLKKEIEENTSIISKKIVAIKDNLTIDTKVDEYVSNDLFNDYLYDSEYFVHPVKEKPNLGYVIAILISAFTLGCIIYFYKNYENSVHQDTQSGVVLAPLVKLETQLKNYKKEERITGKTKKDVIEQGKKEFLQEYYSNLYSTKEIHENLTKLFDLPFFIYDWQLSKIVFRSENNGKNDTMFYFIFQRLEESTGTYQDVIDTLEIIQSDIDVDISPKGFANEKGDFYIFQADFDFATKNQLLLKHSKYTDFVSIRDNEVANRASIVANYKNNIYSLIEDNNKLTKLQLLGGVEQNNIKFAIEAEVVRLQAEYIKVLQLAKTEAELITVDNSFTNNSKSNYILLKQKDYLYEWSLPRLTRTYPDWKRFLKDNKQTGINKNNIDKQIYAEFAQEYEFEVRSVKDLSENFVSMLSIIRQMNDPSIQIKQVEYNIDKGTWVIKASFYVRQI